jgi:tRNA pseudouridine32 synthase/23S rRNA pseudouridine746 synthase
VARLVTLFQPPPAPSDLPERFPSPFDELGPHPLARRAAELLLAELREGRVDTAGEGKMFGVLVVRTEEGVGFLRAFSGMLAGRWEVEGFVPPVFDRARWERLERAGEREVSALDDRCRAFAQSEERLQARARVDALSDAHRTALARLRAQHAANKAERTARRLALMGGPGRPSDEMAAAPQLHALDQESRRDKAELRRLREAHALERTQAEAILWRLERRLEALERLRGWRSRRLMRALHDTYRLFNARGESRPLRVLFSPGEPPSGAGDCAAPKLLAAARASGWAPLALAEVWWGPPPPAGARVEGEFYPACREKCAPLLPFLLEGIPVAPPRRFAPPVRAPAPLRVVYEDAWLVVIDKPEGLLSVPGKTPDLGTSVLDLLRARHPDATGPLLVHRLDLDTSGLLVACLDARAHAALQRQFLQRAVQKRYVAVLDGTVCGERGTIDLPLRVDLHDRPRQIHDPRHGKPAVTDWEVVGREAGRTRVSFWPRTGRTHQLRVHAAHPLGLGAPIVGDRLYGRPSQRLLLHAAGLAFLHPVTGVRLSFEAPPPF